jgi:hypothetical protein
MTIPPDWTVEGPWSRGPDAGNTRLDFSVVGHPWDGCPDTIEPKLGPTFDDLVTYLADLPQIDISESTDVTVDGYRGKYLRYTPVDKWFDCFSASPIPVEPGTNETWIVDVEGVRVVIAVISDEQLSDTVRSEVRQMVESIHFER